MEGNEEKGDRKIKKRGERRNKYHKIKTLEFRRGQKVLIRRSRISRKTKKVSGKLSSLNLGPAEIKRRLGVNTYLVKMNRRSKSYQEHNIVNLYRYVMGIKGDVEEKECLGNIRIMKGNVGIVKLGMLKDVEVITEEIMEGKRRLTNQEENLWKSKKERSKNKKNGLDWVMEENEEDGRG